MEQARQRQHSFLLVCIDESIVSRRLISKCTISLKGMLEATHGTVTVDGWNTQTNIEEVRRVLGFCPQYGKQNRGVIE